MTQADRDHLKATRAALRGAADPISQLDDMKIKIIGDESNGTAWRYTHRPVSYPMRMDISREAVSRGFVDVSATEHLNLARGIAPDLIEEGSVLDEVVDLINRLEDEGGAVMINRRRPVAADGPSKADQDQETEAVFTDHEKQLWTEFDRVARKSSLDYASLCADVNFGFELQSYCAALVVLSKIEKQVAAPSAKKDDPVTYQWQDVALPRDLSGKLKDGFADKMPEIHQTAVFIESYLMVRMSRLQAKN